MKRKLALAMVVLPALVAIALLSRGPAVTAQERAATEKSKNSELHQAQINYAKAILQVAEADLAKAREANSKVPDTIPNSVVRGLENDVAMAAARVQGMLGNSQDSKGNPYVQAAQGAVTYAEETLKRAQDANARVPSANSKAEIDRRLAEVNLARTQLEVAKLLDPADALQVAEWELLQLQANVHELKFRVKLLQERN